jgi:hypothetical protein
MDIETIFYERRLKMSDYEKLEWLHFAISEAIKGNIGELSNALEIVEQLREPHLEEYDNE